MSPFAKSFIGRQIGETSLAVFISAYPAAMRGNVQKKAREHPCTAEPNHQFLNGHFDDPRFRIHAGKSAKHCGLFRASFRKSENGVNGWKPSAGGQTWNETAGNAGYKLST